MPPASSLPAVNASLNALSAALLVLGWLLIKRRLVTAHRLSMGAAFLCSVLFLASYLYYHSHAGHVPFTAQGWIRPVYFFILISHIVLAAVVPFLAVWTLARALRGEFEKHKRIARWTYPVWVYVSVTGVAVYLLLYRIYPAA